MLISGGRWILRAGQAGRRGHTELSHRSRPEKEVKFEMRCAAGVRRPVAALDLTLAFKSAAPVEWQTLDVPLSCLGAGQPTSRTSRCPSISPPRAVFFA